MCGRSPGDWRGVGGESEFTISALVQKRFSHSSAPGFFQFPQEALVHQEGVEGSRSLALHTCQAPKHWPKSKPQCCPLPMRLFPSWSARREKKSMSGPSAKVQECLSPSRTGSRQSRGATGRTRGTGRTGERGREPTRGLSAKGAWKSLVRHGCGLIEASWLHGFFLPVGTSAELHLSQLDVPNHIGVCGERKHSSGTAQHGLWWCLQRRGQSLVRD